MAERSEALIKLVSTGFSKAFNRGEIMDALIVYGQSNAVSFADLFHFAMARRNCRGNLASFDRKRSRGDVVNRIEPGA